MTAWSGINNIFKIYWCSNGSEAKTEKVISQLTNDILMSCHGTTEPWSIITGFTYTVLVSIWNFYLDSCVLWTYCYESVNCLGLIPPWTEAACLSQLFHTIRRGKMSHFQMKATFVDCSIIFAEHVHCLW